MIRWTLIVATGCATTTSAGIQSVTSTDAFSVEATGAAGAGLGDENGAFTAKLEGALGAGPKGVQGRVGVGYEWVHFGDKLGWQAGVISGASLGGYQSPDWTLGVTGGPHWNISRAKANGDVTVTSIAVDGIVGYGFRVDNHHSPTSSNPLSTDGAFVGAGLSFRRDHVTGVDWKPYN